MHLCQILVARQGPAGHIGAGTFLVDLGCLGGADPGACPEPVPLGGEDGRPSYFASPNDNVSRVVATLERSVGRNGFTFVTSAHFPD